MALKNEAVKRIACWAHVRRKFVEAESESPSAVRMVLRLIGQLYRNESDCDQKALQPQTSNKRRFASYRRLVWSALVLKRIEKIVKKTPDESTA